MDRRYRIARRCVAAVATLGIVGGCARQPREYVIGAAGPLTLGYGIQNQRGIDLAVDEINRAGGIRGVPLRVVTADDHATGADAARVAGTFVANPQILAVVGHVGSAAEVAAAHVYDVGHLPAVATTPSSPDITAISPWVFRMITSDSTNGAMLARFATRLAGSLGHEVRIGVLYRNDAYGRGLADAFVRTFRGAVVNMDPIGATTDLEPFFAFYRTHQPDVVFVASDENVGIRVLREARRQHVGTTFLGGDGWQGVASDSASEGAYVGTPFTAQSTDTAARRFTQAFRARYGVYPDAHAALAYDATRLLARAIQRSGADRAAIRTYLAALTQSGAYQGVSGPAWFASSNDRLGETFGVARVHDGVLLPVVTQ